MNSEYFTALFVKKKIWLYSDYGYFKKCYNLITVFLFLESNYAIQIIY